MLTLTPSKLTEKNKKKRDYIWNSFRYLSLHLCSEKDGINNVIKWYRYCCFYVYVYFSADYPTASKKIILYLILYFILYLLQQFNFSDPSFEDLHFPQRSVVCSNRHTPQSLNDSHAFANPPEYCVLPIQPRGRT